MKRIVASVGLVAVGASGLQAALPSYLTPEGGKPFTLSATLRGFYDDNFNTATDDATIKDRSTLGYEVSPSVQFVFPWEQTTLSFGYIYSLKYYENKPIGSSDHTDQTHDFNVGLNHAFSERYSVNVKDSFVIGQEPDLLRSGNTYTTFQRIDGDNIRNFGSIDFLAQLTPEFGLNLGYANTLFDYDDKDPELNAAGTEVLRASNSGLLDTIDHKVHLDGRYQLRPQTIGVLGAQFRQTEYTGDELIWIDPTTGRRYDSDTRNARSYYGYAGLDHNFRPDLTGSIRGGGYYIDYYNNPNGQDTGSPYAMASLQYTYLPESYLQVGSSYDYSESSAFRPDDSGDLTLNAESFTIFGTVRHRITPKLYGSILAQYQNSTYYGGDIDGDSDNYYVVGVNLQYRFTPNFSAEVGYDYDNLDSGDYYLGTPGDASYDRHRVYIGVTGSY